MGRRLAKGFFVSGRHGGGEEYGPAAIAALPLRPLQFRRAALNRG